MNLLRNPIAVTVLATVAGAYTLWTILGARGFRSNLATAATTTANGPAAPVPLSPPPPPTAATPALPANAQPTRFIDLPAVSTLAKRWIEAPRRDPFRFDRPQVETPAGPPASQILALRAIWRQTGSQLAIINGQILREGEKLQGYAIETIEAEGVWVRGTNGREHITFPESIAIPPIEDVSTALDALDARQPTRETITATIPVAPQP